jgi:sensor histidine kinase regulating citrate/malate metabolism
MRTGRLFTWKYTLFLILLLIIGIALTFPAIYLLKRTQTVLTEETQSKAVDIAHTVSSFLEMDIDMYRELSETEAIAEEDEIWQYYQEANGLMQSIKNKADANLYFTGIISKHNPKVCTIETKPDFFVVCHVF